MPPSDPHPNRTPLPFPWPTGSYQEEREDGFTIVQPIPTAEDLAHYEAALREDPEAGEVRQFYAWALHRHGREHEAVDQARILAKSAEPGSHHHFTLAGWLRETGDLQGSLTVFEEIRQRRTREEDDEQSEALLHWGFAGTLQALGRTDEAILELKCAVELMELGVREDRAAPRLLAQIRREWTRLTAGGD